MSRGMPTKKPHRLVILLETISDIIYGYKTLFSFYLAKITSYFAVIVHINKLLGNSSPSPSPSRLILQIRP